jgi:hypothetical protein
MHAVPAALQRGVEPPHETAQQMPPVPVGARSQLPLTHWLSAPKVHVWPFPFGVRHVPASQN